MKTLIKKLNRRVLILTGIAVLAVVGCSDKKDNNTSTRYQYVNGYCADTQNNNTSVNSVNCNNANNTCTNGGYQQRSNGCFNTVTGAYWGATCPTNCNTNVNGATCSGYYCSQTYGNCGNCDANNNYCRNWPGVYFQGGWGGTQVYCQ